MATPGRGGHKCFQALDGAILAKNHPPRLPSQKKQVGSLRSHRGQLFQQCLGPMNLMPMAKRPGGIDEGPNMLGMLLSGFREELNRLIESIRHPEGARLLQCRKISVQRRLNS